MEHTWTSIGEIRSPFQAKEDCPTQGVVVPDVRGTVVLKPEYADGLKNIHLFSHVYLFYLFDRAGAVQLTRKPFLDDAEHGIYATRHPCRPNGLGMTIVKLISRQGNELLVDGIDVLDSTPLIDIKPYLPRFDARPDANNGWFKEFKPKPENRE